MHLFLISSKNMNVFVPDEFRFITVTQKISYMGQSSFMCTQLKNYNIEVTCHIFQ